MKIFAGLCLTIGFAAATTAIYAGDDSALEAVRADFVKRFPHIEPKNLNYGPVEGMFELRQGTLIAYLSDDGRYLFQGDLIDLENQVNLTVKAASEMRMGMMDAVDYDNAVVFTPEKTAHSVTIFTDIDCTFCRKLHREIDQYMAAGIEVRYLFFPRGGPGSKSWAKSEEVLCAKDRNAAITLAKADQPVKADTCKLASAVGEQYKLGQAVGVQGTPALVFADGEIVSGYLPASELSRRLELVAETPARTSSLLKR